MLILILTQKDLIEGRLETLIPSIYLRTYHSLAKELATDYTHSPTLESEADARGIQSSLREDGQHHTSR